MTEAEVPDVSQMAYLLTSEETPSRTTYVAVAEARGCDTLDLPPLGEAIDADALDRLAVGDQDGFWHIAFGYAGYHVTVTAQGISLRTVVPPSSDGDVTNDITERKEREREVERQQARLEEFASVVSHDLRNPLNVARGRVSIAQADSDSEDLTMAETALDRMEALIDDLLELARQGRMVEATEPVELHSVVDEAWSMVLTDGELEVELDGTTVLTDRDRLCQLFENLFRNAVDHAGSGFHVRVGLLADRQGFYVEDDGPGIPAEEREDVYDDAQTAEGACRYLARPEPAPALRW